MKRIVTVGLFFVCFGLPRPAAAAEYATPKQELRAVAPPYIAPTVLSPAPGQRLYANAFFPLKLAPPQGMDVAEYLVSFEKKDPNGNWIAYTKDPIPVSGPRAQSAEGYNGFSLPAGTWKITVLAFRPTESRWSPWVEFSVVAAPLSPARLGTKVTK
jgi:hypothetical protein